MFYDAGSYTQETPWSLEPFWNGNGVCEVKSLHIEGFTLPRRDDAVHSQLAGSGLRSLQVTGGLQRAALRDLLQQCPNLLHLNLRQTEYHGLNTLVSLPVMPSLRSLTLHGFAGVFCDPSQIAPSCEQLIMDDLIIPGSMDAIENMFSDDSPTLSRLKQCQLYHLEEDSIIFCWLRRHMAIEQLAFTRAGGWGWRREPRMLYLILAHFISDETGDSVLPNLKYLAYEMREEDDIATIHSDGTSIPLVDRIAQLLSSRPSLRFHLFLRLDTSSTTLEYEVGELEASLDMLLKAEKRMKRFKLTMGRWIFIGRLTGILQCDALVVLNWW
ncbi:hypothetical protein DL93DRAFT_2172801 [Clavulina sp. PMI_390]|nr:hypothetical protein DL93DRAFT_2172801 [Clavulina sp. PMI_390]